MTSPLIEAIKKDREEGTPGPWGAALERGCHGVIAQSLPEGGANFVCMVGNDATSPSREPIRFANARRIARVPDLEAALIAAEDLRRCCEAALELMSRHKKEYALRMEANRMADFCQGTREISEALEAYRKATGGDQ